MFLKRIEIFGFKSFADRSIIEFNEGISALLGPNGCGKSNVVDAIKWVLGEQGTKSLRAEKMEDVIFNGTEARKALSMAEVTLVLENSENILDLDLPEIAIKRRLYRSGDSEYSINNAPAKLKELRELFLDTGIGKSAYSIMEQGKIDQVLSNKPEERRGLFEEAAGISKYKIRAQEADRKLDKTIENKRQVENILAEVKRSHDSLQKQAEKTQEYRNLKDLRFELETDISLIKLRSLLENQAKRSSELQELETQRGEMRGEIDSINESLEANLDEVNTMEQQMVEGQKELHGLDVKKGGFQKESRLLEERQGEIQQAIEGLKAKRLGYDQRLEQLAQETTSVQELLEKNKGERESNGQSLDQARQLQQEALEQINWNKDQMGKALEAIKELQEQILGYQTGLKELTEVIVGDIDNALKEMNLNPEQQRQREEAAQRAQGALFAKVESLEAFQKDLIASGIDSHEVLHTYAQRLGQLVAELRTSAQEFSGSMESFRGGLPSLVDFLLSPEGTLSKKRQIDASMEDAQLSIERHQEQVDQLQKENQGLEKRIEEYRQTIQELLVKETELKGQEKNLHESLSHIQQTIASIEQQKMDLSTQISEEQGRLSGLETRSKELDVQSKELAVQEKALEKQVRQLEKHISQHNKTLLSSERSLKTKMGDLAKIQAKIERLHGQVAELKSDMRNLYENYREHYGRDLNEFQDRMYNQSQEETQLKSELSEAKTKLKALGSVNLMAPEEFAEVKSRYDFLHSQLEDLSKAQEDLTQVTSQIKAESAEQFLKSYEQIKKNFHTMFRRLFGGGRAELRLLDPDHVLESGIEMFAQPPGKKLENIALLSGGERSLTAVALLFATYLVKPSPFCVLDEIDAALDESNIGRFINMLHEFGKKSQFIVITHNKKTVTGARTLLGVTMEESGVSKIVSIKLGREGEAVEVAE